MIARVVFEQPCRDELDNLVRGGPATLRGVHPDCDRARPRPDHRDLDPSVVLHPRDAEYIQIPDVVPNHDGQRFVCGPQLTLDVDAHLCLHVRFD